MNHDSEIQMYEDMGISDDEAFEEAGIEYLLEEKK